MASGLLLVFLLGLTSGLPIDGSEPSRVERSSGCPSGWSEYGSRCFNIFTAHRTMAEAELFCTYYGGHLASVRNYGEQTFISNLIYSRYHHNEKAWIGINDIYSEGLWRWTDGSRDGFTFWSHGEPNNYFGVEDCTVINWHETRWNDVACSDRRPYVCAKDL